MAIFFPSRILAASALGLAILWTAVDAQARRRCVPTLYNCNCTFAQPCPTKDVLKTMQTSLAVAREQLLLEAEGVFQSGIDALQATVPPEAVGLLQRIPAQQLLNATMRGMNPANMLGVAAPLAGLAFGASPIAGPDLALAGQALQIGQMAMSGQGIGAAMAGANLLGGLFPETTQAMSLARQGMQVGQMMANGQIVGALPGVAQLAMPALGLMGAADALGGAQVVQQGFQVVQGLGALSQQAMALRGASMLPIFTTLPSLGAASYASPAIATHAAAWLPPGAPAPSGGDFGAVRQAVVEAYGGREDLVAARRRADAATVAVAMDAQAKALQIRHGLRRHAEIALRLEAGIQAARTVGDDWRANAAVQMALSAIDDEIREAEAMLLALRSSHAAARVVGQQGLQALSASDTAPAAGAGRRAVDGVAGGRTDRDAYVDTIVRLESRPGDPGFAHPNSTAVGDGQFLRGTWNDYVRANPDRFAGMSPEEALARRADPMESRRAIAWYADRNGQTLARAGMPVNNTTLGLAHRFGANGSIAILRSDPNTPIERALPNGRAVLAANPDLRGQTVGDVVERTARAFGG